MSSRAIRGVHGRTIARGSISAYTRKRETNMKVGVTVRVLEDAEEEEKGGRAGGGGGTRGCFKSDSSVQRRPLAFIN